jgi:hypothetical protein
MHYFSFHLNTCPVLLMFPGPIIQSRDSFSFLLVFQKIFGSILEPNSVHLLKNRFIVILCHLLCLLIHSVLGSQSSHIGLIFRLRNVFLKVFLRLLMFGIFILPKGVFLNNMGEIFNIKGPIFYFCVNFLSV